MTWGAGGSTSDLTLELCIKMKEEYGMEPNMHLTWCVDKLAGSARERSSSAERSLFSLTPRLQYEHAR